MFRVSALRISEPVDAEFTAKRSVATRVGNITDRESSEKFDAQKAEISRSQNGIMIRDSRKGHIAVGFIQLDLVDDGMMAAKNIQSGTRNSEDSVQTMTLSEREIPAAGNLSAAPNALDRKVAEEI